MKKLVSLSAFSLCASLLLPQLSQAANLPVSSLADDGSVGTLRYVLKFANDGDVIEVPAGVIVLDTAGSTALDSDATADLDIDKNVTIQGSSDPANPTVIDANGPTTNARVFDIDEVDSPDPVGAILVNLTIQNGKPGADGGGISVENEGSLQLYNCNVVGNDAIGFSGGGIHTNDSAALVIGNSTISNNEADNGGGLYVDSDYGTATVKDSVISDNHVTGAGAGVWLNYAPTNFINTRIDNNVADSGDGGGVHVDSDTATRFVGTGSPTGCSISGNSTDGNGAGIYAQYAVLIDNCRIENNQQTGSGNYGGGIYLTSYQLELRNSTVSGNHSAGYAGGVYNDEGMTIVDSTISNNIADEGLGGGIYNDAYMSVEASVISGNVAKAGYGGGIYNASEYMTINNTVIVNNSALDEKYGGGGVYNEGDSLVISNSLIAGNVASGDDGSDDAEGGGVYTEDYPLVLVNTTIANNQADGHGGGIFSTDGSDTAVDLNNVTITGNVADANEGGLSGGDGGGLFNGSDSGSNSNVTVGFSNSIIAGNEDRSAGNEAPDCFNDYSVNDNHVLNSVGPNIIQDLRGCDVQGDALNVQNVDPLFDTVGLADNNGPSVGSLDSPLVLQTIGFQSGSPAIDKGQDGSCEGTDQREVLRPIDGDGDGEAHCDLGALEAAATSGGTAGGTAGTTGGDTTGGTTTGGSSGSGGCSLIR